MDDDASQVLTIGAGDPVREILPWLALLLGLVVIGAVVISVARRQLNRDGEAAGGSFTLHELRTLHAKGDLSDEEFERARTQLIERMRDTSEKAANDKT